MCEWFALQHLLGELRNRETVILENIDSLEEFIRAQSSSRGPKRKSPHQDPVVKW